MNGRWGGRASDKAGARDSVSAEQLIAVKNDRDKFDPMLSELSGMKMKELVDLATKFLGYKPGHDLSTKGNLIAALKRNQRQHELNTSRTIAQSKIRP